MVLGIAVLVLTSACVGLIFYIVRSVNTLVTARELASAKTLESAGHKKKAENLEKDLATLRTAYQELQKSFDDSVLKIPEKTRVANTLLGRMLSGEERDSDDTPVDNPTSLRGGKHPDTKDSKP